MRTGGRTSQERPPAPYTPRLRTQAVFRVSTPRSSLLPTTPEATPPPTSVGSQHRLCPFPPPPPWGADSPGCHVSLVTSPGPLRLSQSARGSSSKVLASESAGRRAGKGGGGLCESGEWGGRQPLKYACTRGAGLGGKLSPSPRAAPSVSSAQIHSSNSLSRHATRCGRPPGSVKALRSKAFLFPGSPAAILGGSDS